ncbi:MAG: hypothetical protein ISP70_02160 [Crocinitomicaceae bacterium]|nr:hypothetical protein [Crocinitomicaceae bacterium]
MKKAELKYIGYVNNHHCFQDDEGKAFKFARIRTDLIFEHHLYKDETKGQLFTVHYFISTNDEIDVPILSNLEVSR